jgi:hypothetical protein
MLVVAAAADWNAEKESLVRELGNSQKDTARLKKETCHGAGSQDKQRVVADRACS